MGKARSFSDESSDKVYQQEIQDEIFNSATQQNSYNLGNVTFSDQSGIGNFAQSGSDQRKANLDGVLFRGNIGFNQDTCLLDVATMTIDLLNDATGNPLSVSSTDKIITLSMGMAADLVTILGAQRPGHRLMLYNVNTNTVTIKHTPAATPDTIRCPNDVDYILSGTNVVELVYDITKAQWRVVGVSASGGGGTSFPILYPEEDLGDQELVSVNIDISGTTGQNKKFRMTGDVDIGFSVPPGATVLEEFWVRIEQDVVGGHSIDVPPVNLKNGLQLDALLDKTANGLTLFHFVTNDSGDTYFGELVDLATSQVQFLVDIGDVIATGASNTVLIRNFGATQWISKFIQNENVASDAAIAGSKIDMLLNELSNVGTTGSANTVLKTLDGITWGGGNIVDNNVDGGAAIAGSKIDMLLNELSNVGTTGSANTVLKTLDGITWGGGNIVDNNVDAGAAIAGFKINMGIDELNDVNVGTPSVNTVLKFFSGEWVDGNIVNDNVDGGAAIAGSKIDMLLNELSNVGTTTTPNTVLKTINGVDWGGGNIVNDNVDAGAAIAGFKIDMLLNELSNVGTTGSANTVLKTLDGITWGGGNIVNNNVDAGAAIEWSKIDKTGSVLDDIGDVNIGGTIATDTVLKEFGGDWVDGKVINVNVDTPLITGFTDIATVDQDDDRLLIFDSSEGGLFKVAPGILADASQWSTFPALQNVDMSTNRIINVVDPTNPQDAATMQYVIDEIFFS